MYLCAACPEIKDMCTLAEFKKGKRWASTRAKQFKLDNGQVNEILVPYVEMAPVNQGGVSNAVITPVNDICAIIATRTIKKGEAILPETAKTGNLDVFLNSGFVPENNDY